MKYNKQFEEFGYNFLVQDVFVTTVVFFFLSTKIQLNAGVCGEVFSYHTGTGIFAYYLLP